MVENVAQIFWATFGVWFLANFSKNVAQLGKILKSPLPESPLRQNGRKCGSDFLAKTVKMWLNFGENFEKAAGWEPLLAKTVKMWLNFGKKFWKSRCLRAPLGKNSENVAQKFLSHIGGVFFGDFSQKCGSSQKISIFCTPHPKIAKMWLVSPPRFN